MTKDLKKKLYAWAEYEDSVRSLNKRLTLISKRDEKDPGYYDSIINRRDQTIQKMIKAKQETMEAIERLENTRYKDLMIKRYIERLTWPEIAKRMGYDMRWVQRLHRACMEEMEQEKVAT